MPTKAERAAEDPEISWQRRQTPEFIAADMLAEKIGQAAWQRLRRDDPVSFIKAKFAFEGGPTGLWFELLLDPYRDELIVMFEWPTKGEIAKFRFAVSFRELQRDESGDFLRWCAADFARQIERESGALTVIHIRGNRDAWERHETHKGDPPAPRPSAHPRKYRQVVGEYCGTCRARFRFSEIKANSANDFVLPCGHRSAGRWTE